MIDGARYRFRRWPDDGEAYRLVGDRLVNLTTPGADLGIDGTRILSPSGVVVGDVRDIEIEEIRPPEPHTSRWLTVGVTLAGVALWCLVLALWVVGE